MLSECLHLGDCGEMECFMLPAEEGCHTLRSRGLGFQGVTPLVNPLNSI